MNTMKMLRRIGLVVVALFAIGGNSWALNWTYQYDSASDASGGSTYEVYRMGYAFDQGKLYVNILTGLPQTGSNNGSMNIAPGDLFINVGGSLLDGYTGSGVNAKYATGNVFGLALTNHAGDMNNDMYNSTYYLANADNSYAWSAVTAGHLYSNAMFSTGTYEAYSGASGTADGGKDPFGGNNNAPAHIAQFGLDLGLQGAVTYNYVTNVAVNAAGTVKKNAYEINAVIGLDALGIKGGEKIDLWWSMECGNDFFHLDPVIAPAVTGTPEPGTLVLLGLGLLAGVSLTRKVRS